MIQREKHKLYDRIVIFMLVSVIVSGIVIGCAGVGDIALQYLPPGEMLKIFLGYLSFFGVTDSSIETNLLLEEVVVDIFIKPLDLVILLPQGGMSRDLRAEKLQATRKYSVLIWWEPAEWADEKTGRALRDLRRSRNIPVGCVCDDEVGYQYPEESKE